MKQLSPLYYAAAIAAVIADRSAPFCVVSADASHRRPDEVVEPIQSSPLKTSSCNDLLGECPFYGCPLLPRDIHYDDRAQAALNTLRRITEQDEQNEATSDQQQKGGDDDSDADTATTATAAESNIVSPDDITNALVELQSSGTGRAGTLTLIGYKGGRIEDQINQDRAFVISPFRVPELATSDASSANGNGQCIERSLLEKEERSGKEGAIRIPRQQFLGVFDGHDKLGEQVSEYATQNVPKLVANKLADIAKAEATDGGWTDEQRVDETKKLLSDTFIEVDANSQKELGIPSGGCTASVVLHLGNRIYVANAGDSRSLVATYVRGRVEVVYVSREDKPDLPSERERVEKSGGKVYLPKDPARESSRVYYIDASGQFRGGLAMSRSLGDWDLGPKGVIPDPLIDVLSIDDIIASELKRHTCGEGDGTNDEEDKDGTCSAIVAEDVRVFAVSATDGVLDYVDPTDIARVIGDALFESENNDTGTSNDAESNATNHLFSAQTNLMLSSAQGWQSEMNGEYRDDMAISVAIIR